jgi:hypothetical protein
MESETPVADQNQAATNHRRHPSPVTLRFILTRIIRLRYLSLNKSILGFGGEV